MRIPDPKANTTTEAYLAYKAGYLEESELKPKLYEPYLHFDAWLAYWAGLTNTYPLDKNGDPEMLTDEEALVAYLSGVTDTYPEEIKDPYDVRIVGYLKHLASIRWPEPDYPVNNEEFYLSTMEPTHTSNSVPSSDIELDTAEGKIIDVKAYGNATQTTYSGKNLFSGDFSQFDNQGGTGSTYAYFELPDDGVYTLSLKAKNAIIASNHFLGFSADGGSVGGQSTYKWVYQNLNATAGQVFTSENISQTEGNRLGFVFMYPANATNLQWLVDNFEIQLERGSTATAYEPYVGGTPAPNPSYPQPISVVTGENVVKIAGGNVLDIGTSFDDYFALDANGTRVKSTSITSKVTGTIQDGKITVATYDNSGGYWWASKEVTLEKNTNYTFSTADGTHARLNIIGIADFEIGTVGTVLLDYRPTDTAPATFNTGNYNHYVFTFYPAISSANNNGVIDRPMLQKGTTATAYEPYTAQDYAISLTGKNLFNKATSTAGYRIDSNGDPYANASYFISDYIAVQPSTTYAYSRGAAGSGLATIAYYKSDKTFISRTMPTIGSSDTSGTVTTPNNAYYARFCDVNEVLDSVQLELGSTATEYEAYSSLELAKIGTYQDRIYKDGEKWYVEKNVGKVMLDKNAPFSAYPYGTNSYATTALGMANTPTSAQLVMSDRLYGVAYDDRTQAIQNMVYADGGQAGQLDIRNTTWASVSDLTTWLSTHPTTVYYALATPTTTEITNQTLIDQLEALAGADTYNEKTYIKVTATEHNLPALLKVEAYKY